MPAPPRRVLAVIPAYNEAATIRDVVGRVRESVSRCDLLVVDDGSQDATGAILRALGVGTATHLCNLGYGRALQTALKYAFRSGYDALVTLDADGQHHPEQIEGMIETFAKGEWDVLLGSRYIENRDYSGAPLGRRLGMQLFSWVVGAVAGQRVYDTTSGLKILRRTVFEPLARWHFVDFHAEAIVYLLRLGYRIGEYPVSVSERAHGQSMYSALSHIEYPLKTALMVALGVVEARLSQRRREG